MNYSLGNTLSRGGGSLNADGLSLDLQFATDKSLTARKGPTPVFTRASTATHYAPLIDIIGYLSAISTTGIANGRASWGSGSIIVSYTGTRWKIVINFGEPEEYLAALGSEFRPDQANWRGAGASVTTSSTFGIVGSAINEPRFDHATTAPNACRGLLIEESRTNLVFPSATLTTQTRTVTATAHTLSFYGTGTVVLSGAHVATVTGTGAFPTRTTLTFTPTAGSLTLTVTGSVQFAQLEAGSFATSYIPTSIASAVRSADVCSITGANFTGMYNQSEGTVVSSVLFPILSIANLHGWAISDNTSNNRFYFRSAGTNNVATDIITSGSFQLTGFSFNASGSPITKSALAIVNNNCAFSVNGGVPITDASVTLPVVTELEIGASFNSNQQINGHIHSIRYYKKRLSNAKLQTLTT